MLERIQLQDSKLEFEMSRAESPTRVCWWCGGATLKGKHGCHRCPTELQRVKSLDMKTPRISGIVNITEDSFSDGGEFLTASAALSHARRLLGQGADILDLGPAASHPDAIPVSPEEEIRRLDPVITALNDEGAVISVDSFQSETQRYAMRSVSLRAGPAPTRAALLPFSDTFADSPR